MIVLLQGSPPPPPSLQRIRSSVKSDGFVTSLTKALLVEVLYLAGWPTVARVLVASNFYFTIIEATVLLRAL